MKLGKDFILGIVNDDSGAFEPLAFAQSCSYDINNTLVKVSSPNTGGYEHYRKKTTGWAMQHEGLIGNPTMRYTFKGQQYDFISLISRVVKTGEPLTCRWHEHDEIKQGQAIVKSYKEVGSEKALAKVSIALQGTGELRDLDPNDLEGSFVWVRHTDEHDVPHITLYAIDRTIANFSVVVRTDYHGGQDFVEGTWEALGSRTQTFNCPQGNILSVRAVRITADEKTIEQPRVMFSDATSLHVVLLQTDTRDEQQQLHRYVQPLWWGGYALGNMAVKNSGNVTLLTLPTTGANGSIDPVEIDPSINLLAPGVLHIDMTGDAGQTAHCCDRTASLEKTLTYYQTANNVPGGDPYMIIGPGKEFHCNFRLWGNDNEGNELFSFSQDTLIPLANITAPVPAVANLHFQLEGLGVDDGGPWNVTNVLTSLLEPYDLYYAYDADAKKLTLYSPNVSDRLIQGVLLDGGTSGAGSIDHFYDLDSEGNRVPVTYSNIPSFTAITPMFGNGTMHDVSSLTMVTLTAQPLPAVFVVDKLPLADIVLYAADEVTEIARIPALTTPGTAVASVPEITDYTFVHMADGAVQTLTIKQYQRDVVVATRVVQAQSNQWTVTASLIAISTGSAAILPGALTLKWPGISETLVIPAGASSAQGTLSGNPSWGYPTATLDDWASGAFFIVPGSTVDVTPANWKAYKLGTLNGKDLYDVQYAATTPGDLLLTSSDFTGTGTFIAAGTGNIASHLLRVNAGDTPTIQVRESSDLFSAPATVEFQEAQRITDQPVVLRYTWYYGAQDVLTARLTNLQLITPSRHTNICEVLPYMRCRNGQTQAAIYGPAALAGMRPGNPDEFAVDVRKNFPDDMNDRDGVVEFCTAPTWGAPTIPVGNNLPGLEVHPYWSHNPLPKA